MSKTFKLEINDVFQDIKHENTRLLREIKFAQKLFDFIENYRNFINNCLNCGQNEETKTKFNELELNLSENLNLAKQQLIIVCQSNDSNYSEDRNKDFESFSNKKPFERSYIENLKSIRFVSQLEPKGVKKSIFYASNKPFKCHFCRNSFDEEFYLNNHLKTHHLNERNDGKYYCCDRNQCNYKTKNMTIFRGHRMRHLEETHLKSFQPFSNIKLVTDCDLDRHSLKYNSKCYICDWPGCNITFRTSLERSKHRIGHICPPDLFSCDYPQCITSFRTKRLLNIHKNKKHFSDVYQNGKQMKKNVMKTEFKDLSSVSEDIQRRLEKQTTINATINDGLDPKDSYFQCNYCSKRYKNRKHLLRHCRQRHQNFDQKSSEQSFEISEKLIKKLVPKPKRKYGNSYPKNRPFGCHICRKNFSEEYILNLHINTIHSENDSKERYFCCEWKDCKYKTKNMSIFKDHRKRHLGNKEISCLWPSCDHMFVSTEDMKKHLVTHQDIRKYSCVWPGCLTTFKTQQAMQRHMDVHTHKPDELGCEWPQCPKRFRNLRQMRRHLVTVHKGYRKYVCHWPQCGKQFTNSTQLETHLSVHSGLKPHTCPSEGCDKRFADKSNMYKHIRLIHKKT